MKTIFTFLFVLLFLQTVYSQWEMMNSPTATPDIRKVVHHPNGDLYVTTSVNELFRSTDNSITWNKITSIPISNLFVSPEGTLFSGITHGYNFSIDYGVTWHQVYIYEGYVSDIEFDSPNIYMSQGYIYSGFFNGVWVSTNGGINWNRYTTGLSGEALRSLKKDSFGNIYTVTWNGEVYKSTDNGQSWQFKINLPGVADDLEIDSNNNLFVASNIASTSGIYKSTDLGNSWFLVSSELTFNIFIDDSDNIYSHNFDDLWFSSDAGDSWENLNSSDSEIYDVVVTSGTIFIATAKGLQKSLDFGINWTLCFKYSDRFVSVNDATILPNGKIFVASAEGLFISHDNGNTWDMFRDSYFNLVKQNNVGNIFASTGLLFRSSDEGISWNQCGNVNYIVNFFINDSNYILSASTCNIFESSDHGVSWDTLGDFCYPSAGYINGISQNTSGSIFISTHRFSGHPMYEEYKRLFKTENNGVNWSQVRNDLYIKNIYFIKDTMYLATSNQTFYPSSGGIFKSYDNGINIIALNNGLNNYDIKQLILKPEVFLALSGDGIYRSLDNGEYWVRLDHSGLQSPAINRIYYSDEGVLYACTDNGIYVFTGELPVELLSFNAKSETGRVTLNWSTASELNNQGFEVQRKSKNTEWITIGFKEGKGTTTERNDYTYSDDVTGINTGEVYYRLKQIDFDGTFTYSEEVKVGLIPFKYELFQNYPNPFNPTTTISWQSPVGSHQTLKVYDVLGNEVATLVNEYKDAGSYEVEFDASSLASGMYIYKLNAGSYTSSKKMLILK